MWECCGSQVFSGSEVKPVPLSVSALASIRTVFDSGDWDWGFIGKLLCFLFSVCRMVWMGPFFFLLSITEGAQAELTLGAALQL